MKNIKFIALNYQARRMLLMIIGTIVFILYMSIIKKEFIVFMFTPVVLLWVYFFCSSLNVCILKKDQLIVMSDDLKFYDSHAVQKGFIIKYDEIDFIQVTKTRYKNTRNEKYLFGMRKVLSLEEMEIGEEALYQQKYRVLDLEILQIHIKDSNKVEGIVLNPFSSKQKKQIIDQLNKRIMKSIIE